MVKRVSETSNSNKLIKIEYEDIQKGSGELIGSPSKNIECTKGITFKKGDLLFGKIRPYLKNYLISKFDGVAIGNFWVMRPVHSFSSDFLFLIMNSQKFFRYSNVSYGTKMPIADWNLVSNVYYWAPEIKEQKTIGKFFSNYQSNELNKTTYVDKLKQVKDILLSTLFINTHKTEPEIRLKEFKDKLNIRVLGDFSNVVKTKNKDLSISNILTISSEMGIVRQSDFGFERWHKEESLSGRLIIEPDDFVRNPIISKNSPAGPIRRNNTNETGIISNIYFAFRVHSVDKDFLEHYFFSNKWNNFVEIYGQKGARVGCIEIQSSEMMRLPIPIPSIEEQSKIGKIFKIIDKLINLKTREIQILKDLKTTAIKMFLI
ncbi:restriction endonuclease subunit S [Mycoplasma sp. Ms02]|uniref:restriction endonuclease subunit S n=1 Tax=Mycoplasma sp. Ms02 TaxID=353851 RepID=UPI001C8AA48D|nr:restriction endonuclease subunit S [Mycoplasma sp. Ms02]QZE12489.1 restriction endonuclease subunit S [Mycoplasma sp. Ms02]